MPLAFVNYRDIVLDRGGVKRIVEALPELVAKSLSVEEGRLVPGEVGVRTRRADAMDILTHDVEIVVFANHYPEREAKVQEAAEEINTSVEDLLAGTGLRSYVWVLLTPGGFSESQAKEPEPVEHFSGWRCP